MVDDQLAIAPCGLDAVVTNSFMNAQTNLKRMQYGAHKCFRLHIGKNCNLCSDLNVDTWDSVMEDFTPKSVWDLKDVVGPQHALETVDSTKYLGDIFQSNGRLDKNIQDRVNRGYGIDRLLPEFHLL